VGLLSICDNVVRHLKDLGLVVVVTCRSGEAKEGKSTRAVRRIDVAGNILETLSHHSREMGV
jgi:hypothetical protein